MNALLIRLASITAFLLMALCSKAQTLPDETLASVGFEQKLGTQIPMHLGFRDESGKPVTLADLSAHRPVILVMAYYDCPGLCTLVLNGLTEACQNLQMEAGRDYQIVVVSIRPNQLPTLAAAKKRTYVLRYGRPGGERGLHFLTGEPAPIQELAQAVGFKYAFDPATNQYAHGSGITVLSPDGKVSRYLLGFEFSPTLLKDALAQASEGKTGPLAKKLLLLCFNYNPLNGKYGPLIGHFIQAAGIATVLLLGTYIARLSRPHP